MPLKGERRKLYMREYMRRRREEERASEGAVFLRLQKVVLRKAMKRLELAKKLVAMGEEVDPASLSLGALWNMAWAELQEEEAKKAKLKRAAALLKKHPVAEETRWERDRRAVGSALGAPHFPSLP